MRKLSTLVLALLTTVAGVWAQTNWTLDKAHSSIGFTVAHNVVAEAEGQFKDFDIKVTSPSDDFNGADVEFVAKVASINTGNENRDNHLRSPDFFDAATYPEITFKGKIVKEGNAYKLVGDFTMHGITKQKTFDVAYGGTINTGRVTKAGFKVTGTIDRFEHDVKYNRLIETGGLVVGQEVSVLCRVELNKANQ